MSRRGALLTAAASVSLACQSRADDGHGAGGGGGPRGANGGAPDGGGLDVVTLGKMRDDEQGGTAVVLLHGWGAHGQGRVGLAHALTRPRARFFVPAAP